MADSYSRWVMTDAFANNSQAAINAGQKIEWVSIKTSDDTHTFNDLSGFNDTTLATATIRQTTNISSVTITGKTVTITGLFNSNDNRADYYIRTMFLVARYNGKEFLAGATVANSSSTAFRMPAASGTEITEFTARPQISVSNTSTISATVNPVASATNERVDSLEADTQAKIDYLTGEKDMLWDKFKDFVTKATAETVTGVKTFTQTIVGSITGNAGTATKLQTGRRINGTVFDGTADINVPASNDADIVHKSGMEVISGYKKFTEVAEFTRLIKGGLESRSAPFTDLATVAADMNTYAGIWWFYQGTLLNSPIPNYAMIEVVKGSNGTNGYIRVTGTNTKTSYFAIVNPTIGEWIRIADDARLVHKTGAETVGGNKTFTDLATFAKPITGAFATRVATFTDFSMVAADMNAYAGQWRVGATPVANSPVNNLAYYIIEVVPDITGTAGIIRVAQYGSQKYYYNVVNAGKLSNWHTIAQDDSVVHKSGNEDIAGTKKFTGNAIFNNLIDGYTKTSVAPSTDLNSITKAGKYEVMANYTNIPAGMPNAAVMLVENNTDNGIAYQFIFSRKPTSPNFDMAMFFRLRINAAWTPWREVAQNQDVMHLYGNETVNGVKNFVGGLRTGNTTLSEGRMELYGGTPYIDFHFNNDADDYTARIIETSSGVLTVQNKNGRGKLNSDLLGQADTATKLATPRKLNGVAFDGTSDIVIDPTTHYVDTDTDLFTLQNGFYFFANVVAANKPAASTGYFTVEVIQVAKNGFMRLVDNTGKSFWNTKSSGVWGTWHQDADDTNVIHVGENAASATKLQTARLVGGVSFDGTKDIVLPGVNAKGNQDTSGRAANADLANKAVALNTPRKINGTDFDGTADINVNAANDANLVHKSGNEVVGGDKEFTGTTTLANVTSKNVIKKSMTLNNIILDFSETASGVVVYVHSNGRSFLMDSTWHDAGTLPAGITPPPTIVIADSTEPAGIVGLTTRMGFNIKISISPTGKISYKLSSLREGDTASRTADVSFDAYTSWFK